MSAEYWKSHYDAAGLEPGLSLLQQVGKTVHGKPVSEEQIDLIVNGICRNLQLDRCDSVLDLCCGNGLLTSRLAPIVDRITGIDYSQRLIEIANIRNAARNVTYLCRNILELDEMQYAHADKILMYEALQHLSVLDCHGLADMLRKTRPGTCALIASIPDRAQLGTYYNTQEKMDFYNRCERENRPHMGRWWLREEVAEIADAHGLSMRPLEQDPRLYTAYYRFDVLLGNP
jgi:ubiquinone/menaquinone biosynthesis C-methylase UbiE